MGKLKIDLDQLFGIVQKVSVEGPSLLQMAASQGVAIPGFIGQYLPFIGVAAQAAQKFMPGGGISKPGLPDTGPPGRGRTSYLLRRDQYSDANVIRELDRLLDPELDLPKRAEIKGMLEFTASAMFPNQTGYTDIQRRAALETMLINDGLPPKMCDRLGDMLFYGLTHFNK